MIRRSQRQRRSAPTEAEAFRLHLVIAARAARSSRLLRGSVGALLGSLVTMFLGWPWSQQAAALAAGFAVGAALPVRGHARTALAFVRQRAGLSYETALEAAAARSASADPYALVPAVRRRALESIRDVRPPDRPAWWLPCLAAALALLLVPLAAPGALGGAARDAGTTAETQQPDAPAAAAGAEQSTAPGLPQAAPDRVQSPGADTPPPDPQGGAQQDAQAPGGGTSDQMTLSRYMESLRQRPSDAPGPQSGTPPENLRQRSGQGQPDGAGGGARQQGQGQSQQADAQGAGENGGAGAGQQSPDRSSDGSQGGTGDQGKQDAGQGQASGDQTGQGTGDPSQQDGGQAGGGEQPSGDGRRDAVDSGLLPGEQGPNGTSQAGNLPGEATPAGPGVDGQPAPPEFLEGQLRDGPENPGGAVRLPGSKDVTLPPGTSTEGYRRAAEQALTEGDLPLEYQDIIRRYFR